MTQTQTHTPPKDDHKADRQAAFDLMKGKHKRSQREALKIAKNEAEDDRRRRGGGAVTPRSQQAWKHVITDPYGMSLPETAQAFRLGTWTIGQMRKVLRQFKDAGLKPSGDWRADKRGPKHSPAASPEVTATESPEAIAQASPEAVLQALLEIARECAEDLRTIRIEAERLEAKAQQARQAACFYAQAQGLAFDGGDFTA